MTNTGAAGADPTTTSVSINEQAASVALDTAAASKLYTDADAREIKPVTSIHRGAVAIALAAYGAFIGVACIVFGRGYGTLDLTVVIVISAVLFGLLVGGAMMSRNMTPERATTRTFGEFVSGTVDIETGRISGRAALVQIVALPILLAIGGAIMSATWLMES